MRGNRLSVRLSAALAIIAATLVASSSWVAAQETVLHSFNHNGTDGYSPTAGLIFDPAKINLYGTTNSGGTFGDGTVFELTPQSGGGWAERVLYSFCLQTNCTDGACALRWPNLRCRWQSLRHDHCGRCPRLRDGVRVDARNGRELD